MSAATQPVATATNELDALVQRVKEGSRAFARISIDERIELCERMRQGYASIADASAAAACVAKGVDPNSPVAGEEWISGPMVTLRILRLTGESLRDIKKYGVPKVERSWCSTLADGRT